MKLHITLDASLTAWIEIRSKHDRLGTSLAAYLLDASAAEGTMPHKRGNRISGDPYFAHSGQAAQSDAA